MLFDICAMLTFTFVPPLIQANMLLFVHAYVISTFLRVRLAVSEDTFAEEVETKPAAGSSVGHALVERSADALGAFKSRLALTPQRVPVAFSSALIMPPTVGIAEARCSLLSSSFATALPTAAGPPSAAGNDALLIQRGQSTSALTFPLEPDLWEVRLRSSFSVELPAGTAAVQARTARIGRVRGSGEGRVRLEVPVGRRDLLETGGQKAIYRKKL